MAYIVAYDLNDEKKRPPIVKAIKAFGSWAQLSESAYAIDARGFSVEDVYNRIKQHIDSNDQLYVVTLSKPWTGFGPKDVNEWLSQNL